MQKNIDMIYKINYIYYINLLNDFVYTIHLSILLSHPLIYKYDMPAYFCQLKN